MQGATMGTQSEQLERKANQVRARLTETLEELRAGMTPGQVVDRLSVRKAIERIRFTKKKSPALPNGALRLGEPPGSGSASLIAPTTLRALREGAVAALLKTARKYLPREKANLDQRYSMVAQILGNIKKC
jgi:hypothetical protein